MLAIIGRRVNALQLPAFPRPRVLASGNESEGFWSRLASFVLRHPWRVLVPVLVVLLALGAPFTRARLSTPDARILPPDTASRRAADLLAREFDANAGAPLLLAVTAPGPTDPATVAAVAVLRSLPADLKSLVVSAAAPTEDQVTLNLRGGRRVLWGDASDNSAKAAATRVLLRQKGRLIDVTAPGLVTVR
jgi:uncharacterized membrane protein YdfJ with MMPL/SSD domain